MPQKTLIIGTRWNGKYGTQDAIIYAENTPTDWIWWKKIRQKTRPTWAEWEVCWRNLSGMQTMNIPIHQSMRLLQHHGPIRLRKAWGWGATLLGQGQPLNTALNAVFHLPLMWLPLFQNATITTAFLASLATFCEKKKMQGQSIKRQLRYPLIMSIFIMTIGLVSTLELVPHASTTPSQTFLPPWLPYLAWSLPFMAGLYVWGRLQRRQTPFFRFLEIALKAGYTEHEAIHHFCHLCPKSDLVLVHQRLQKGNSFDQSLRGIWPDAVVDLVSLNSDRLDVVVASIADMVEMDEQEMTERWLAWTQSSLIIMMGLMVIWMAWTTLIPLYESLDKFAF